VVLVMWRNNLTRYGGAQILVVAVLVNCNQLDRLGSRVQTDIKLIRSTRTSKRRPVITTVYIHRALMTVVA
jgi:hypothetical protein